MQKAVRIKRLKQLKKMLINHDKIFPKIEFNLDTWKSDEVKKKGCGTAACALGSACFYKPFQKEGLEMYGDDEFEYMPVFQGANQWEAGAKFFGIDLEESEYLFDPAEYHKEYDYAEICPGAVAKRVQELITKYQKIDEYEKRV